MSRAICLFLSALMSLTGCTGVGMKYHEDERECSALKVYPYWKGEDGEKYLVGGLRVRLAWDHPEVPGQRMFIERVTSAEKPLFFEDLEPGKYRLRVWVDEETKVFEQIEILRDKRLTVRIDVDGVKAYHRFRESLSEIGEGIGDVCVFVGGVAVYITVSGLVLYMEAALDHDHDEDD